MSIRKKTYVSKSLEDFIFTYNISPNTGLKNNFKYINNLITSDFYSSIPNTGLGYEYVESNLGFDFKINNILYSRMIVLRNGCLILVNNSSSTTTTDILNDIFTTTTNINNTLLDDQFPGNYVVICPWFSKYAYCRYTESFENFHGSRDEYNKIRIGKIEYYPKYIGGKKSGVWSYTDDDTNNGISTTIRWNILVSRYNYSTVPIFAANPIEFECEIFKNGTIRFRYNKLNSKNTYNSGNYLESFKYTNPSLNYQMPSIENSDCEATIGIFLGENGHRDLSFEKLRGILPEYKYGGFEYQGNFTVDGYTTYSYVISNNLRSNWPGRDKFNAEFVFQPQNYNRNLFKLPIINDNNRLINKLNYYDDRLTPIITNKNNVSFPSTINRYDLNGTVFSDKIQKLFNSSFQTSSYSKLSSYENLINDITYENSNIIFQEDKRDIDGNQNITILNYNLNIEKSTLVPTLTSNMYAFDINENAFLQIDPSENRDVNFADEERNFKCVTHIGFSPVGNQIVSSSADFDKFLYTRKCNLTNYIDIISKNNFDLTFHTNSNYRRNENKIEFNSNNNHDFYLEDIEIDLDLDFRQIWFDNITRYEFYSASILNSSKINFYHSDSGGPGITVALFLVKSGSIELISKGLISHNKDYRINNEDSINVYSSSIGGHIILKNYMNNFKTPDYIVEAENIINGKKNEKIKLHLKPKVYTGAKIITYKSASFYTEITTKKELEFQATDFTTSKDDCAYFNEIDQGSRNKLGFNTSDRSTVGELVSLENNVYKNNNTISILNPYYENNLNSNELNTIKNYNSGTNIVTYIFNTDLYTEKVNPYILRNKDKLLLTISKTRPVLSKSGGDLKFFVSEVDGIEVVDNGDFIINSSSINIKLSGFYKQNNNFILNEEENKLYDFNNELNFYGVENLYDMNDIKFDKGSYIFSRYKTSYMPSYALLNSTASIFPAISISGTKFAGKNNNFNLNKAISRINIGSFSSRNNLEIKTLPVDSRVSLDSFRSRTFNNSNFQLSNIVNGVKVGIENVLNGFNDSTSSI